MGSSFSVINDTPNDMHCLQTNDKDAIDLFLQITEWMSFIGGVAIPGLGSWSSYVTKTSTSLLKLSGLSPNVVKGIMAVSEKVLNLGPSVTSYIVNHTIQNAKDQGYKEVKAGKTFWSSKGTLSLRQALTCITVNQVLDLKSNLMYVKTNEIYMGNLYTGSTIDSVNSYKVSDFLFNRKEVSSVEIEPPYGFSSWMNLDMNLDQFSNTFTSNPPTLCEPKIVFEGRPFGYCISGLIQICDPRSPFYRSGCDCWGKIQTYGEKLNTNWKNYLNSCNSDAGGLYPSRKCTEASQNLRKDELIWTTWTPPNRPESVKVDGNFTTTIEKGVFQAPGCKSAYACKKDSGTGQPWDTCLSGVKNACSDNYNAGSPCECKKKIMAVRDQLNPTWKYYFNQCAHSDYGIQSDCDNARDTLMKKEMVVTNMVTNTTKPNQCGINVTYLPASKFISVSQTQEMIDYVRGCSY